MGSASTSSGVAPVLAVVPGTERERAPSGMTGFVKSSLATVPMVTTLENETVKLVINKEAKTYQIEGWEAVVPGLPEKSTRHARTLTQHGEAHPGVGGPHLRDLCHPQAHGRLYNNMLKVRHASFKGGSMTYLRETDPGSLQSSLVCAECSMPWTGGANCLRCKCADSVDLADSRCR